MAKSRFNPADIPAYSKAIAGAVTGVGTAVSAALLDGHIDGGEVSVIVAAVIGGFLLVYNVPRNRAKGGDSGSQA